MTEDMLQVWYLFDAPPDPVIIERIIDEYIDMGCTTTEDGQTEVCKYKRNYKELPKTADTETAVQEIAANREGGIEFWYKDLRFDFEVNMGEHIVPFFSHFTLKIWDTQFRILESETTSDVSRRVRQFLEIAKPLAELADPIYAYGSIPEFDNKNHEQNSRYIKELDTNRVFWFNIFSEGVVRDLEKERILSAPAWEVEELSTSSILLVVNDYPRSYLDQAERIEEFLDFA